MRTAWANVTFKDVVRAIELFEREKPTYPEPKNTFLLFKNKKYPAKHIRGLAYKIANKREISKGEYSGGQETTNFLRKLGFIVDYKKNSNPLKQKTDGIIQPVIDSKETPKLNGRKLSVVVQKNALQKLLQIHYGHIETEKKFTWLRTPNPNNLPKEYASIVKNLFKYRNQNSFLKANHAPICDIVLDERKLIIEYDENQHFSKARQICLESYPSSIRLCFSKEIWISACQKINAKDNFPIDRDERRAYYDTVRDIEAFKNGYTLIRIKHGDVDWEALNAEQHLKEILSLRVNKNNEGVVEHKIARIVVSGKHFDKYGDPYYSKLIKGIEAFLSKTYERQHFEFIVAPGGFLKFQIPESLFKLYEEDDDEVQMLPILKKEAERTIVSFFKSIPRGTLKKLKETANYMTIGIDGRYPHDYPSKLTTELVCVYDLSKESAIHWTGKFYPVDNQKRILIKVNDLNSHFIKLNNQRIAILGCHDLNVYNPRGQASAGIGSWKRNTSEKFRKLCKEFNPDIILQHPHTTDTANIWNLAWRTVEKELPKVRHFASGINYHNWSRSPRGTLDIVLLKTKKGDVVDFKI